MPTAAVAIICSIVFGVIIAVNIFDMKELRRIANLSAAERKRIDDEHKADMQTYSF